jgi:ribosome-binding factor A
LLEVSFTDVQVSDDLRHAKVFYTFVGEEGVDVEKQSSVTKIFKEISPRLQRYLGGVLQMKYTPRLKFYYDETLESARRIEAILDGLRDETGDDYGE